MINITNYFDHPTRPGYTVFRFSDQSRAHYFENQLRSSDIWFELSKDEKMFLFGIKKRDYKVALHANYMVSATFRKKTIPNKIIRLVIYIIVLVGLAIAIIGALKS